MTDIMLGQYFPGDSPVHRLDPRIKIILTVLYMAAIFVCRNFISLSILFMLVLFIIFLSRIPLKMYVKSSKTLLVLILFTSIVNIFYGSGTPIFEFGFFKITQSGLQDSLFVAARLSVLMLVSSTLTFVTSPADLTNAIEWLIKPIGIFGICVHDIAMMMTIALRFVPTLLEEADKTMNAQKARGANMESKNLAIRIKSLVPILIPLFVSSFRKAYDLAIAMECRCYNGGKNRTSMKVLKFGRIDMVAVILFVCLFTLCFSVQRFV